jgi:hypothetical protein
MFLYTMYQLFASVSSVPSATNVCGTVGIHNDTKISYYMGNFFYKGPSTFTLCASYCRKDAPKCKSFRYSYWEDSAAQYCEFFDNGLYVLAQTPTSEKQNLPNVPAGKAMLRPIVPSHITTMTSAAQFPRISTYPHLTKLPWPLRDAHKCYIGRK